VTVERYLRLIAGLFVLATIILGYWLSPYWFLFTVFVALNLIQSAFTNWCPMMTLLRWFGVKEAGSTPMKPAGTLLPVFLLLLAIPALAQPVRPLSLSEAVSAAYENQPSIRAARLRVDLASARIGEANGGHLPSLHFNETITRSNNPVFVFGSLLEQGRFGAANFSLPALNSPAPVTNLRTTLSAGLPVFDAMKTSMRVSQADAARQQAIFQEKSAEQQVRFAMVHDYFGVLVAEANRTVANQAVRMAEGDLQHAKDRLEAGLAVDSDVLAVQVQLAEFKQQQIQAEGDQATAAAILNIAIGSSPLAAYKLSGELAKREFIVPSQDELVRRAMLSRPDYLGAASAIQSAAEHVSEQRGDYLPQINLFGSVGSSAGNFTTGSTDYSFGTTVTFDLFDAGRASRLSQAHIQESLAQTERDRLRDQILVEVSRAYYDYRAAEQQVEVAETALSQASEALRIIQDRYEAGLTTVTDVLRAETAFVRARVNVTASRHKQYVRYASLLVQTGELNDVRAFEP
jgi:outer membrane protein TolC